jgi:glycosyltransferase involved in cell wall biosynthesis
MREPEVSVVMGVYNAGARLSATLASVLDQEGCVLEFIVVNDGSTDGSGAILDEWASRDARLRVIHQPNTGLTGALVRGCEIARAPLIARQDAGDWSLPGRLRGQADAFARHPELSFVSCATEYVDGEGEFLYRNSGTGRATQPTDVVDLHERWGLIDGPSHHGSAMFSRAAYMECGGYRRAFHYGQDWDLWYRLAQSGRFCMLPDALYRACVAPGDISLANKPLQDRLAALSLRALRERVAGRSDDAVLAEAARVLPVKGARDPRADRRTQANGSYFLGECLRRNGNNAKAIEYFRQATRARPGLLKAWVRLAQAHVSALGRR